MTPYNELPWYKKCVLFVKVKIIKIVLNYKIKKQFNNDDFLNWVHRYHVDKDNSLNARCELEEKFVVRERAKLTWARKLRRRLAYWYFS